VSQNQRIDESASKDIRAYFGSSGSGKTHNIKQDTAALPRVLAFDPEGAFNSSDGFTCTTDRAEFYRLARGSGNVKLTYQGNGQADFNWWCNLVFALADCRRPCGIIVDELAGVTTVSKALPAWHQILTRVRKYGGKVFAGAQSPTEIDKTLMRQKNKLFVGYLERPDDHAYMAKETGIPEKVFLELRPDPYYEHVKYTGRDQWAAFDKSGNKKPIE
jgi:hypothetical protein